MAAYAPITAWTDQLQVLYLNQVYTLSADSLV